MQNDILKNIETFNKAAIDSAKRLGDINMRTFEKLAQRNLEAAADYLDGSVQQLKLMGESKDIQSVVKEQARLSAALNEKFVEHAKKTAEVTHEYKIPKTAKPGLYVGRFRFQIEGQPRAYHVTFVVKKPNEAPKAPILVIASTNSSNFCQKRSGCPMSTMTLKNGIERILKQETGKTAMELIYRYVISEVKILLAEEGRVLPK